MILSNKNNFKLIFISNLNYPENLQLYDFKKYLDTRLNIIKKIDRNLYSHLSFLFYNGEYIRKMSGFQIKTIKNSPFIRNIEKYEYNKKRKSKFLLKVLKNSLNVKHILKYEFIDSETQYLIEIFNKYPFLLKNKKLEILDISNIVFSGEAIKLFRKKKKDNYNLLLPFFLLNVSNNKSISYIKNKLEMFKLNLQINYENDKRLDTFETFFNYLETMDKRNEIYDFLFVKVDKIIKNKYTMAKNKNNCLHTIVFLIIGLFNLKKGGNCLINITIPTNLTYIDLFMLCEKYFDKVILDYSDTRNHEYHGGIYFVCQSFKGLTKQDESSLKKLIIDLIKGDPSLGKDFYVPAKYQKEFKQFDKTSWQELYYVEYDTNGTERKPIQQLTQIFPMSNEKEKVIEKFKKLNEYIFGKIINIFEKMNDYIGADETEKKRIEQERHLEKMAFAIRWAKQYDFEINPNFDTKVFKDYYGKTLINEMYSFEETLSFKFKKPKNKIKLLKFYNNNNNGETPLTDEIEILNNRSHKLESLIDTRNTRVWYKAGKLMEYYPQHLTKIGKLINQDYITQAWLKMYEILSLFHKKIFNNTKKTFTAFHACEAPGTFILATNHFIKTRCPKGVEYKWMAQSLNPFIELEGKVGFKDNWGLIKKYKNNWKFGADNTGDITNIKNIEWYHKYCENIDFLTFDCGTSMATGDLAYNIEMYMIYFGLYNTPLDKTCLMKIIYPINDSNIIVMLYYFYQSFKEVVIYKPRQNYTGNEFYILGFGKKKVDKKIMEHLKIFVLSNGKKNINLKLLENDEFLYQFHKIYEKLVENKMNAVRKKIYFTDNYENISKDFKDFIDEIAEKKNLEWLKKFKILPINENDKI
jgi:hypothetical protein